MVHESKGTDPIKRSTIIGTRVWSLLVLESMDCRLEYIERLDAARSVPDLDAKRAAGNEKLLVRRS
jgi:hypothetical protein